MPDGVTAGALRAAASVSPSARASVRGMILAMEKWGGDAIDDGSRRRAPMHTGV
jgi:hypothetical protein